MKYSWRGMRPIVGTRDVPQATTGGLLATLAVGVRKYWLYYAMMAPFLILFAVFTVGPVLTAIYLSFTYFNVLQPPRWVGLANYRLLFVEDDLFLLAVKNTLTFAIVTGPVGFALSFLMAWLIYPLKTKTFLAILLYAPSISGAAMMGVVWTVLFAPDRWGYLNQILLWIGLIPEPIAWLLDVKYMMSVVILVSLWQSMGTGFLVFLAGLANVPESLYEAGRMDGISNKFQELIMITLPMMKPQLLFGSITAVVGSFSVFGVAVALTGFPSPLYATHTILAHMHDFAFTRFEMGYSSAIAVVLFLFTFLLSRGLFRLLQSKGEY